MLSLKVAAPGYLVVELVVVLLQDLNGLGVGNAAELGVHNIVEAV